MWNIITFIICAFLLTMPIQAQKVLDKSSACSGYAFVKSTTTTGHITVGLPMAERISGPSISGWVGFHPVKRTRPTSVDEEPDPAPRPQPNPATTTVHIPSIEVGTTVSIVDMQGSVVTTEYRIEDDGLWIDTAKLPSGTYSVMARKKRSSSIYRFVVSH